MPSNLNVYPTDFEQITVSAGQSTVDTLSVDTRSAALKQQLNRRLAGLFSARNQNAATKISHLRMPFDVVGANPPPFVVHGTIGFFVGGQNWLNGPGNGTKVEHMPFAGEWVAPIGSRLTEDRQWPACCGNKRAFWTAGGWRDNPGQLNSTIDKTTLIDENTVRIAASLTAGGHGMVGCGDDIRGYIFGSFTAGWNGISYGAGRRIHRITYQTDSVSLLGQQFDADYCCTTMTAGTRSRVFLFGGVKGNAANPAAFWIPETRIRSLVLATETLVTQTASMSGLGEFIGSAKFGNHNVIYIVGGCNINQVWWGVNARSLLRYRITPDTIALMGIQLEVSRNAVGGFSSNLSGYVGGGFAPSGWAGGSIRSIEKMTGIDGTEALTSIGTNLYYEHAEHPGVSDYAAGHSS
jgi:hypothetical protein